jgi:hypothetical protein
MASDRVLTHHVNVKNPKGGKVQTFEPGETLPDWADKILTELDHDAYPVRDKRADALVKSWSASKLAAEAAGDLQD